MVAGSFLVMGPNAGGTLWRWTQMRVTGNAGSPEIPCGLFRLAEVSENPRRLFPRREKLRETVHVAEGLWKPGAGMSPRQERMRVIFHVAADGFLPSEHFSASEVKNRSRLRP